MHRDRAENLEATDEQPRGSMLHEAAPSNLDIIMGVAKLSAAKSLER